MKRAIRFGEMLVAPQPARVTADLQQLDAERRGAESVSNVLLQLNILQTVVFSDHKGFADARQGRGKRSTAPAKAGGLTHAVCKELSRAGSRVSGLGSWRSISSGSRVPSPGHPIGVSFEFLMVKLLRAYGECLGARSR